MRGEEVKQLRDFAFGIYHALFTHISNIRITFNTLVLSSRLNRINSERMFLYGFLAALMIPLFDSFSRLDYLKICFFCIVIIIVWILIFYKGKQLGKIEKDVKDTGDEMVKQAMDAREQADDFMKMLDTLPVDDDKSAKKK